MQFAVVLLWGVLCAVCKVHPFCEKNFHHYFNCISLTADVPLTVKNVCKAVEAVRDWNNLGVYLNVPKSKRGEIRQRYSTTDDRKQAVVAYWIKIDPIPSWRRVIRALGRMGEHQVADAVRPYAEPLTGLCISEG